jgi:hypothetical protein
LADIIARRSAGANLVRSQATSASRNMKPEACILKPEACGVLYYKPAN